MNLSNAENNLTHIDNVILIFLFKYVLINSIQYELKLVLVRKYLFNYYYET